MGVDAAFPLSSRKSRMVVIETFVLGQDRQIAAKPMETWIIPSERDAQDFKDQLLKRHFTSAELEFRNIVIAFLAEMTADQ
jgi:hypothetical protein